MMLHEESIIAKVLGTNDLGWGVDVALVVLFVLIIEGCYAYWCRKDTEPDKISVTLGAKVMGAAVATGILLCGFLIAVILATGYYYREHVWVPVTVVAGLGLWTLFNNKILQPYMMRRNLRMQKKKKKRGE